MIAVTTINFHSPLSDIRNQLSAARKDVFSAGERIVIHQDCEDNYPYVDGPGERLIEIQHLVDQVDISNDFILIETTNSNIESELKDVVTHYSYQVRPFNFKILPGAYTRVDKQYSDTSCAKLWEHLYVGTDGNTNPCCIADKRFPTGDLNSINVRLNSIKQHMANGHRSRVCSTCYKNEDLGLRSARIPCDYTLNDKNNIISLDIRISNLCNFKCRMCSEEYSSAILDETIKIYGNAHTSRFQQLRSDKNARDEKFTKIKPYINKNLKSIYFAGGEPLISQEHYDILDQLLNIDHTKIKLSYNTNFSQMFFKKCAITDYWNQFDNVFVGASLDAEGAVAEYIRHGTIWSDIENNISLVKTKSPHVDLRITSTVGFLNVESLISLQKRYLETGMFTIDKLSLNTLTSPSFLSVAVLPKHHKQRLNKVIQQHISYLGKSQLAMQWDNLLSYMMNNDVSHAMLEFKNRMKFFDQHRGESFGLVFPQYNDLYDRNID